MKVTEITIHLICRDEWRTLFDKYDPEGFGEIPLDDFEVALETRDFLEAISPGKLIILQVNT